MWFFVDIDEIIINYKHSPLRECFFMPDLFFRKCLGG
jgi:hypothetical protein